MEIRRFFINPTDISGSRATISGTEFLHLKNVLRLKVGFKIVVCVGDGLDRFAEIDGIYKDFATASVTSSVVNGTEPKQRVALAAAVLKGGKLDFVVQKAVELGATAIIPFVSENCTEREINLERLQRVALEAAKQCGRARLTEILPLKSFEEALVCLSDYDTRLFFCEFETRFGFADADVKGHTALVIGSEGGFTEGESGLAVNAGFQSVSLGKRILRADTASVTALALTMYRLGAMLP
ncbi:MAG: 16S rRNA (uracil(1498)-N(3))-methyltransferase [Clostridiaceae bacterium]|jgi:16S rRNA (uracil1498-N3)-methyltransferase|nr:16S rRNA (uracil(1498)-N(3))-methyltransferase [Clostridiaceae bacterium]